MTNTASAAKRARQSARRYARNRWYRGRSRTFIKRARGFIESGSEAEALQAVRDACRALDRAAQKGVIHENNAARRKSRLMKAYNAAFVEADAAS